MQLIKQRIRVILLEDKFSIPFRFNNHLSAIKNSEENFPRDTIFPAPFLIAQIFIITIFVYYSK